MGRDELSFDRAQWAALRANTPLDLGPDDVAELQGINERLDIDEVTDVYLPLSRLLSLHAIATAERNVVTDTFVGALPAPRPYVLGLAGSVAVGKSTTARILQALLSRWPAHPRVALVPTDGFLYPNRVLAERGLTERKGFPESYNTGALVKFLAALKAGEPEVTAPVYSHVRYDILDGETQVVREPDIVLVEGLNVLQITPAVERHVSDFFDFTIYVDAEEADIERWFVERFFTLRGTVFADPDSFFHNYASLGDDEAEQMARFVWRTINGVNLREEILPTRARAQLVLEKGPDHRVRRVRLRR
ncbi:MAG TPA: type I pantothenate kinase [Acidimicrobiales bacterium]|nr:type I pantothenate kinase [Acidimicrobiales bacterium]